MDTKTPNKRKSVAKATTPNKIQKLTSTPVFQKSSNKSPKSANKINIKQENGNKSPKSSKINQKNQTNGAKITAKGKKPKQIEDDETDDSDELNDSDVSNDAADSDNEDAQIENADSEDDVEAASDDAAEGDSDEAEGDSDEAEADSDEAEADSDEAEADSEEAEDDSDEDAEKDENDLNKDSEEENKFDFKKENDAINRREFGVVVKGLKSKREIELFFHDCNIKSQYIVHNRLKGLPTGFSFVNFKDKESFEKALERNGKIVNDCKISVEVKKERKMTEFSVLVKGLGTEIIVNKLFKNCDLTWWYKLKDPKTQEYNGRAFVSFKDKASLENALKYNLKEFFGHIIVVEPVKMTEIESEINKCNPKRSSKDSFIAFVTGISNALKLRDLFKDCKVVKVETVKNMNGTILEEGACVDFEDEESVQKALLLHKTEYDGCVIKITRKHYDVHVGNINSESDIKDIFKDCNIQSIILKSDKKTNEITRAVVNFKDKESFQKALSKNGTKLGGQIIKVAVFHYRPYSRKPYKPFNKPEMKKKKLPKHLLVQQLKNQAQHLEREINKKSKPFFKKTYK